MKNKHIICLAFIFLSCVGISQTPTPGKTQEKTAEEIYTSLKPKDGAPAVFSSKAELDAKKQSKIHATLDLIRLNKNNPALLLQYRETLWRFENAIVAEPKN
jgi:hypothetical protein